MAPSATAAVARPSEGAAAPGFDFARHRARFAAASYHQLVSVRRTLHAHPELAWNEHRTRDLVRRVLAGQGLQPIQERGTGLVYELATGRGGAGPTVALRADMDALPIADKKQVAYRSTVPGVAHACGHDVHTTILAGVALLLARGAHLLADGRVRLIFQPAEETLPGGALDLVRAAAVMDGVDSVFALHCDPSLPVGTMGMRAGPITSACDQLRIVLEGPGGHTSRPHLTTDLVHVTSLVASRLPALVGERTGGGADHAAVVFGAMHTGATHNVIPMSSELLGTVRTRTRSGWAAAPAIVAEALQEITHGFDVTCRLDHTPGAPPVENDPRATALAALACEQVVGAKTREVGQSMGADDFSWYLSHAPGCYMRLGVGSTGSNSDLHTGAFDADEAAIPFGVQVLASVVEVALNNSCAPSGP